MLFTVDFLTGIETSSSTLMFRTIVFTPTVFSVYSHPIHFTPKGTDVPQLPCGQPAGGGAAGIVHVGSLTTEHISSTNTDFSQ